MIKVSETESKVTAAKKNISVKNVHFEDGVLVDEKGVDVIPQIEAEIPKSLEVFSFKISFEIPEDEEE